jgi:prepilin-type N-terminal cleavage/methylation domain-containing protein
MSAEALAKEEGRMSEVGGESPEIRHPHSKGFSLMELLVVVTVILILMGLLFPAVMGARERSKLTRARSEVQTLQQAWLAYWNTYGDTLGWPNGGGNMVMDPVAVAILAGVDEAANPYKIAFMEFDQRHLSEGFKDPWRKEFYQMELTDGDSSGEDTGAQWYFTTRVHCVNTARYRY